MASITGAKSEAPIRICMVEDDAEFGQFTQLFFMHQAREIDLFSDAESFMRSADVLKYDFFLIDLTLKQTDGVDLIHVIRRQSEAGIIIISGRMGPDAFNSGLSAGADMFLNKPVRFDQIALAIETVRRRLTSSGPARSSWTLSKARSELTCSNGKSVLLSQLESHILAALAAAWPEGLTRSELASSAGAQETENGRNLDAAMFRLRKKIEHASGQPAPLKTIHSVGYAVNVSIQIK
jgi:two-component system OmpR family response regulator